MTPILILEDMQARVDAARGALSHLGLSRRIEHALSVDELELRLESEPWLVSLDMHLGAPRVVGVGQVVEPGTGMGAAVLLAARDYPGQVFVHTSDGVAAEAMIQLLADAGVRVKRVRLEPGELASAWADAVAEAAGAAQPPSEAG